MIHSRFTYVSTNARNVMTNSIFIRTFVTIAAALLITGCETIPPMSFSVPNVGVSQNKIDAELKSLTVNVARPDEQKGDLDIGPGVIDLWKTSLTEALDRMVIFQDDSSRKVSLSVKVLKLDAPAAGASMTTDTVAVYEITDRKTGDLIYTQEISSSGTVPFDYAFMGLIRARESINRSVQNNISSFLQALETVDVSKPMFPVSKAEK